MNTLWKDWCWSSNTLATWCKENLTHWKRPWCWERLKTEEEEGDRGWDGWMASSTQWTWVWANLGDSEGQGGLTCFSLWNPKESDTTEWLNKTKGKRSYPAPLYCLAASGQTCKDRAVSYIHLRDCLPIIFSWTFLYIIFYLWQ